MFLFKKYIFLLFLLLPFSSFAYDAETTHAGLARETASFYRLYSGRDIKKEFEDLVVKGAVDEDSPASRVLNHFYDPIRNIGINDGRTSKDWALDGTGLNEHSWPAALRSYAEGDEAAAFYALGHILHLVEDLSVPDHTRNDPHIGHGALGLYTGNSPYEDFSEGFDEEALNGLGFRIFEEGDSLLNLSKLDDYFDFLAGYSNGNFFSEDTILGSIYSRPIKLYIDDIYIMGQDQFNKEYFRLYIFKNDKGKFITTLSYPDDTSVLDSYFKRLSRQAILTGAGVIDLFFKEAARARKEYEAQKLIDLSRAREESGKYLLNFSGANLWGKTKIVFFDFVGRKVIALKKATGFLSRGGGLALAELKNIGSISRFSGKTVMTLAAGAAEEKKRDILAALSVAFDSVKRFISGSKNSAAVVFAVPEDEQIDLIQVIDGFYDDPVFEEDKSGDEETPGDDFIEEVEVVLLPAPLSLLADDVFDVELIAEQDVSAPIPPAIVPEILESINVESVPSAPVIIASLPPAIAALAPPAGTPYPGFGGGSGSGGGSVSVPSTPSPAPLEEVVLPPAPPEETTTPPPTPPEDLPPPEETIPPPPAPPEDLPPPAPVDSTPPTVSLTVSDCENSLSLSKCLLLSDSFSVFWSSDDIGATFIFDDGENAVATEATSSVLSLNNAGGSRTVSVSAIDSAGNQSATTTAVVQRTVASPVVINEVAWAGTSASRSEDEWIELYNKSDEDILLDGFTLSSVTDGGPDINLSGTISARGYYLIERKNGDETDELTESPIADIPADLWVSFGSGLSNGGEELALSVGSTTIDRATPCPSAWCGGSVVGYKSAERYDADIAGDISSNWSSNLTYVKNGTNVDGLKINGTPGKRNSVAYLLNKGADISSDLNIEATLGGYIVPAGKFMKVLGGAQLSVGPGVVIKFGDNAKLQVDGRIIAAGTEGAPVVFTHFSDDDFGGDLLGDGACGGGGDCPAAGDWYGIYLNPVSQDSSFNFVKIRYAGKDIASAVPEAALVADGVSPSVSNSIFEHSAVHGLYLRNSNSEVVGNTFANNSKDTLATGVHISGGAPILRGNLFENNKYGIRSFGSLAVIEENEFRGHSLYPIYLGGVSFSTVTGNSGSDNINNYINLSGTITSAGATTTLDTNGLPYYLSQTVFVEANSGLLIKDGVTVKTSYGGSMSRLWVNGFLEIAGNSVGGVEFSSVSLSPSKNNWYGILVDATGRSSLRGLKIADAKVGIEYKSSVINLRDVLFSGNGVGVKALGSYSVNEVENVLFESNNTDKTPSGLW